MLRSYFYERHHNVRINMYRWPRFVQLHIGSKRGKPNHVSTTFIRLSIAGFYLFHEGVSVWKIAHILAYRIGAIT